MMPSNRFQTMTLEKSGNSEVTNAEHLLRPESYLCIGSPRIRMRMTLTHAMKDPRFRSKEGELLILDCALSSKEVHGLDSINGL